jgi:hypothetical protein
MCLTLAHVPLTPVGGHFAFNQRLEQVELKMSRASISANHRDQPTSTEKNGEAPSITARARYRPLDPALDSRPERLRTNQGSQLRAHAMQGVV